MQILAPLRDRRLRMLCGGVALSAIGDQLYQVALSWVSVKALGSAAAYLAALQGGVVLVTAFAFGAWIDHYGERRVMLAADIARAIILTLFVAIWAATSEPGPIGLVTLVVCLAAGQACFFPALQVVVPKLVTQPHLRIAANGLLDSTERVSRLLGPGLVGLLAGVLPVVHFFTVDALSFVASAVAVLAIGRIEATAAPSRKREAILVGIRRGIRASRRDPILGYSLSIAGLVYAAYFSALFFAMPLVVNAHQIRGIGGIELGAYGLIVSSYGATNVLSTLIVGSRPMPARPGRAIFGGNLITGAGMCLLGLVSTLPIPANHRLIAYCLAAALSGLGGPLKDLPLTTLRQMLVPVADLGAATRAMFVSSVGGMVAAMLTMPWLTDQIGPDAVVVACGASFLGIGVVGLARFAGREVRSEA